MTKFTIQDLVEGKCSVLNDGSIEQLRKLLKLAFPEDEDVTAGKSLYYYKCPAIHPIWNSGDYTSLPVQSIKDFLEAGVDRSITPEKAKSIIKIACNNWRQKLLKIWANNIALDEKIEVSEEFYQEMRGVCTEEQNVLFDTIFGKDKPVIDYDRLRVGSKIMVSIHTFRIESDYPQFDFKKHFEIVILNSAFALTTERLLKNNDNDKLMTLMQNKTFCSFNANNMDLITEVIEY